MIATLLKQVLEQISLDKSTEDFDCPTQEMIAMPPFEIMTQFLANMLQDYNSVYIILDGIDEVAQNSPYMVLSFVDTILRDHASTKMTITSRLEEYRIRTALQPYRTLQLLPSYIEDDVMLFVQVQIATAEPYSPLHSNPKLKTEVVEALVCSAKGMYVEILYKWKY
jgi:hypothetical protein